MQREGCLQREGKGLPLLIITEGGRGLHRGANQQLEVGALLNVELTPQNKTIHTKKY